MILGCTGPEGPAGPSGPEGPPGSAGSAGPQGDMGERGLAPTITSIPTGDSRCPNGGIMIALGAETQIVCQGIDGVDGMKGMDGADGAEGPPGPSLPGLTFDAPAMSCAQARDAGLTRNGPTWIDLGNAVVELYCDQTSNGGGWTLLYNSVMGVDTTPFWNIPYAERLGRRGRPSLDSNFYDGALYALAESGELMDVFEDLQGGTAVAVVANISAFDPVRMRISAAFVSGEMPVFDNQVAAGWSSSDRDDDLDAGANCATGYNNVTQHYGACWNYNLGSGCRRTHRRRFCRSACIFANTYKSLAQKRWLDLLQGSSDLAICSLVIGRIGLRAPSTRETQSESGLQTLGSTILPKARRASIGRRRIFRTRGARSKLDGGPDVPRRDRQ